MIKHTVNLIKSALNNVKSYKKRSSDWPEVKNKVLKSQSCCVACGSQKRLNVHHIKPFHLYPDLELDPNNLIVLCMDNDCHLLIGHGDSFKAYNPIVREDAAAVGQDLTKLKEIAQKAKQQRLFE